MPIVLVRVDERLVHGQVLEGWLPSTRAQELWIANDVLARDSVQRTIMESAIPFSVRLIIDTVERIAALLKDEDEVEIRRMILVDDPEDALRLRRAGVRFDSLNLGNLRKNDFSVCLSNSVLVGDDTLSTLRDIMDEGVQINIQSVPFEKPVDLFDACRRCPRT